jgi:hypothetical protein
MLLNILQLLPAIGCSSVVFVFYIVVFVFCIVSDNAHITLSNTDTHPRHGKFELKNLNIFGVKNQKINGKQNHCRAWWCQHCSTLMISTYWLELTSQWKMGPGIMWSHLSMDCRVTVTVPDNGLVFSIPFLVFNSKNISIFSSTLSWHYFMSYETCL